MIEFFEDKAALDLPGFDEAVIPVLEGICKDHGREIDYLNIILVNDEKLLEINKDFLRHDYYTDIITFNYADNPGVNIEGELYISVDRVKDNGEKMGVTYQEEMARVVIHGVLHLCGYHDKEKSQQQEMQQAENKYINQMFHVKHKEF